MYYGPQIMMKAGFMASKSQAIVASIPMAATNFLGTIVAMLYIDRLGRRGMLLWTLPLIVISLAVVSIGFSLTEAEVSYGKWVALGAIVTYIAVFSIGMGPVPWIVN
jgi:MFS family permease